jgi:UDP-galactopyranose mutase
VFFPSDGKPIWDLAAESNAAALYLLKYRENKAKYQNYGRQANEEARVIFVD